MRHLRAILLLPGMATVVVPALIVLSTGQIAVGWGLSFPYRIVPALLGAALVATGLALMVGTVRLFATVGQGTLAPWDPPARLVVRGIYRHVRNPMISGVVFVLFGEAALLGSLPVLLWCAVFFAGNAIYIPRMEEPGLARRFGADYARYRTHVPRWIPRATPWEGADGDDC